MEQNLKNYAYIDGANLHKALSELGWNLDYKRFRVWLAEKYSIGKAYLFLGLIPRYKDLYLYLQECGFTLIFKEVIYDGSGRAKGNCDADLVLQAVSDAYEQKFNQAVIISSDGDYTGLVKFLLSRNQLLAILSPSNYQRCSVLLKRTNAKIAYINDQKLILQILNEKAPNADGTAPGSFS